ncbi:MAG: hypothetical protein BWX93_01845 [Bacteroidetes bacterium ADurb.Bin139]|nr:MAG: hypothetical protein BWX93_01845 [Bacteroidetes bacterium ADurb.Bin139]
MQGIYTGHLKFLGHILKGDIPRIVHRDAFRFGSLFGGDQNNPESSLGAVDRGRSSVFQYRDRFNIIGIDQLYTGDFHVVQQDQRRYGASSRPNMTTDLHYGLGADFTATYLDGKSGSRPL